MSNVAINPFFAPFSTNEDNNAPTEYAIVRRDDVSTADVDRADAEVIEVTLRWGRTVLGVTHIAANGSLSIGEADGGAIMVPEEILGARSCMLVSNGALVVPAKATSDRTGLLAKGERAKVVFGEGEQAMTLNIARVAAARSVPRLGKVKKGLFAAFAATCAVYAVALTAVSLTPPSTVTDDGAEIDKDTKAYLLATQQVIAMKEIPEVDEAPTKGEASQKDGGKAGEAHKDAAGQSGALDAPNKNNAYAIKAPAPGETQEEHLARIRNEIQSNHYLALSALSAVFGNKGPIDAASAWDQEAGHDPFSANGHLTGDQLGDAYGFNGLDTAGMGPGGGGDWGGLGLNKVGGFGHDGGCTVGSDCINFGPGNGPMKGKHTTTSPLPPQVVGADITGIPPAVVQRIVHANFPRFGQCYDHALKMNPGLEGVVTTTFIIDETGAVEAAHVGAGIDPNVNECVASVFSTLSFPVPDDASFSGKARVTYSINFGHE